MIINKEVLESVDKVLSLIGGHFENKNMMESYVVDGESTDEKVIKSHISDGKFKIVFNNNELNIELKKIKDSLGEMKLNEDESKFFYYFNKIITCYACEDKFMRMIVDIAVNFHGNHFFDGDINRSFKDIISQEEIDKISTLYLQYEKNYNIDSYSSPRQCSSCFSSFLTNICNKGLLGSICIHPLMDLEKFPEDFQNNICSRDVPVQTSLSEIKALESKLQVNLG